MTKGKQQPIVTFTIYLGRSIPGGGYVSGEELLGFFEGVVAPLIDSFSVYHGGGYWKGKPEANAVIMIITDNPETIARNVDLIASTYRQLFSQESVLINSFTNQTYSI